jgi:hypothetical protein
MADQKTLIVKAAAWSDDAAELLERSAHDPLVGIATLERAVRDGRGVLFEVLAAGELAGAYVLQVNTCERGAELVVVAAGGNLPGYSLTRAIVPYIEGQGVQCARVRISASRPGMVRLLERLGYAPMATSMVKALHVL